MVMGTGCLAPSVIRTQRSPDEQNQLSAIFSSFALDTAIQFQFSFIYIVSDHNNSCLKLLYILR